MTSNPTVTRRTAVVAAASAITAAATGPARAAPTFHYRFGTNQPIGSPTQLRLAELSTTILAQTNGALLIEIFADGQLGSDTAMVAALRTGALDLYMAGNTLGELSPISEMPSLPFVFADDAAAFAALDGGFGEAIRSDLAAHGLHAFPYWQNGFHHLTSNPRPIQTAADLRGLRVRTPVQKMPGDFFRRLGAEPDGITFNKMYDALRTGVVDAQTDPLGVVRSLKLYEVQRYLSLTAHWWSGFLPVANAAAWNRLPPDFQSVLDRTMASQGALQRADVNAINASGVAFLQSAGMTVNTADRNSFRALLGPFYADWKTQYGPVAWTALERYAGPLA